VRPTVLAQCVTLETIPLILVCNPFFIRVMTLKTHGLFVGREYSADQPSTGHQVVHPLEEWTDFPVWVFLSWGRYDKGVLHAEEALEVPMSSLSVWTECIEA
jgi:hypothetical protein